MLKLLVHLPVFLVILNFIVFRMFDSFLFDMVDGPVDRLFRIKNSNPVISAPYPVPMCGSYTGNLGLPFGHFAGIGTIADWTGKFNFRLKLAPAAREWFVMRRAAWGHQCINYSNRYPITNPKHQLYVVGSDPIYLIPVDTTVIIEHMHLVREGALNSVLRFNRNVTREGICYTSVNLRIYSDIKGSV